MLFCEARVGSHSGRGHGCEKSAQYRTASEAMQESGAGREGPKEDNSNERQQHNRPGKKDGLRSVRR
eukprot:15007798-Alexandrium_andersonii.AAC.1